MIVVRLVPFPDLFRRFFTAITEVFQLPAIISHMLLGQRVCDDPAFAEKFPFLDRAAFLWGCQGPDILFYHRRLPWQSGSLHDYGGKLHAADPAALFDSLAKVCRYCRDRADFRLIYSYALGVCCHYCYDRKAHPLVYYNCALLQKTDERGDGYAYHAEVESNLDVILLRRQTGKLIRDFRLTECLPPCPGLNESVALLYSLLLCDLYGVHTPRADASSLTSDFYAFTSLCDDEFAVKKPFAAAADRLLPHLLPNYRRGSLAGQFRPRTEDTEFDWGNLLGSVWFNPDNRAERSRLNIYELTEEAREDTLQLTGLFADEVDCRGSANFPLFTRGVNFCGRRAEG